MEGDEETLTATPDDELTDLDEAKRRLRSLRQLLAEARAELENTRAQAEDAARQIERLTQGERGA